MGKTLTGDQLRTALKRLGEIERQLGQGEYPYDPDRLVGALQALIEGRFEAVGGLFPSQIYAPELIPEYTDGAGNKRKWEVVEDVEPTPDLDVKKLKFKSFLTSGEEYIGGDEMRQRAVRLKGNFGLSDAPRFLAQQADIPVELYQKYIVLPGTKLRDSDGYFCVACLVWNGGCWILVFYWLDRGWDGGDRFACSE